MQQQQKRSAAAAREPLKAEAQRERRAKAAAQKGAATGGAAAAAPEQRREATGGAAAAPEQMSSGRPGHALEQNEASASSACTPPISLTDRNFFFNGAGSLFGSSPLSQSWMLSSEPATWYDSYSILLLIWVKIAHRNHWTKAWSSFWLFSKSIASLLLLKIHHYCFSGN